MHYDDSGTFEEERLSGEKMSHTVIIPHIYNVKGGVEMAAVNLARELSLIVDRVIFIPNKNEEAYFKNLVPPSQKIVYESIEWTDGEKPVFITIFDFFYRLMLKTGKAFPSFFKYASDMIKKAKFDARLKYLVKRYKATDCLYMLTGGQHVPDIPVRKEAVIHDLFWNFSPKRYKKDFVAGRAGNIKEWIAKADAIFTVSEKVREDVNNLFPGFSDKITAVPHGTDYQQSSVSEIGDANGVQFKEPFLFYPASHSGYQKNFIVLFRAAEVLAKKGLVFELVISGRDTGLLTGDSLLQGNRDEEARSFYDRNRDILARHIKTLGYCGRGLVEALYRKCACTVLPSKHEGYGLPLIESISRGARVICSDIDVFQEQIRLYKCSDYVRIFSPDDHIKLAEHIEEMLLRQEGRIPPEKAKEISGRWTWKDCAKAYKEKMDQDPRVNLVTGEVRLLPCHNLIERFCERIRFLSQEETLKHRFMPFAQTANLAVRREVLSNIWLFRPYIFSGGDADLCWRFEQKTGEKLKFIKKAFVMHPASRTLGELRRKFYIYGIGDRVLSHI